MNRARVLFHVHHLLGIGHMMRTAILARATAKMDIDVTVASGGYEIPQLDFGRASLVQLPPARANNESFSYLVDNSGIPVNDEWRAARKRAIQGIWKNLRPHVLVTEMFPFGRRLLYFELIPLLDEITNSSIRPVIVSSVRDILVGPRSKERYQEMLQFVQSYFDHILVHGDPNVIPFTESFPLVPLIENKLHYTGYVTGELSLTSSVPAENQKEVIVSVGGGAVGEKLLWAVLRARSESTLANSVWRVFVGTSMSKPQLRSIQETAPSGIIVERMQTNFRELLSKCALSISQAGYNTTMDILQAEARCILVPFSKDKENEQVLRAKRLAERPGIYIVPEVNLHARAIADAVDIAMDGPAPSLSNIDSSGATRGAHLIAKWAKQKAETIN